MALPYAPPLLRPVFGDTESLREWVAWLAPFLPAMDDRDAQVYQQARKSMNKADEYARKASDPVTGKEFLAAKAKKEKVSKIAVRMAKNKGSRNNNIF